jgi:mRNA-degrading endonuclease RelE of RelBE toxin-antitoxin system
MTISASEQVQNWLRGLPPQTKGRVRAALRGLGAGGRHLDIKALRAELEGFYRLRVGDYRIVYHSKPGPVLYLDYADIRDEVYETFKRLRALRELED